MWHIVADITRIGEGEEMEGGHAMLSTLKLV